MHEKTWQDARDEFLEVTINDAVVLNGTLPSKQLKLILAWCVIHHDELLKNWELSKNNQKLNKIDPLM